MWDDLLRAGALVLIVEGILPFLSPKRFRRALLEMAGVNDRWMRGIGFGSMVLGLVLLQTL
ncbi:MAG TPA: DUF2065 domain-containing protein [Nevskiaceae bacterium]|nr:DUF2065 domain-containing protein [Nevskiaceae bacterium]